MNSLHFESAPPFPPVSFDYPDSWEITPNFGKNYKEIELLGPRNAEDTFSLAMVVRFTQKGGPEASLEGVTEAAIAQINQMRDFVMISRNNLELSKHAATSFECSFTILESFEDLDAGDMKLCEKRILFLDGGKLVEIIYSATEDDYNKYRDTAEKIIQSLQFG
jgi:hypothetical protein